MRSSNWTIIYALLLVAGLCMSAYCATIEGYVLDPNWYAKHPSQTGIYGTGQYEYGVSGSLYNSSLPGFVEDTDVLGYYGKVGQTSGKYSLATWDTWWRSAYVFNRNITTDWGNYVILRLHANMWSYGPNWGGLYNEFGQMFAASGSSVVMVTVRSPLAGVEFRASIHEGGPNGPQIGPSRTFTSPAGPSDVRLIWSGGEVPTVPGGLYYLKLKAAGTTKGMLCYNDPIPDMSDPMPEGALYHDGVIAHPSADLGVTICSDDDGVLTNMWTRSGGSPISATQVGQTFTARGTSLLSFVAWIPDVYGTYQATLYDGVGGSKIGVSKRSKVMRSGDPEVMWVWSPDECPLTPGNTYYLEITRDGGGSVTCYANPWALYSGGAAYANRVMVNPNVDLAGTIMEEESPGSATRPTVQFTSFPNVNRTDRGTTSLTVRWTTDVASDSTVEYAAWNCPYTHTYYNSALTTSHVVTLNNLQPNTMYHLRVRSAASGYKTGVTRDFVTCTINQSPNLLANPGFESGSGNSPRRPIVGWTYSGSADYGMSDGTWFAGGDMIPYEGNWFAEFAQNGGGGHGTLYQTVDVTPGMEYNFTAAVSDFMQENGKYKYDVWHLNGRLPWLRLGLDPNGSNNPAAASIQWSPMCYSHTHYTVIGTHATAASNKMTVLIQFGQSGGEWLLFGFDDCRLSSDTIYEPFDSLADLKSNAPDGTYASVADLIITATPAEVGAYYAETADRAAGIRIVSEDSAHPGTKLKVNGILQTDPVTGERSLVSARFLDQQTDTEPEPLLMQCKSVGGEAAGLIGAIPGSVGPHNTGLAVKVAGRVTVKDPGGAYLFINDGSMPGDGLKIDTSHVPSLGLPAQGETVGIAGISCVYVDGSKKPVIIVRRIEDLSP